MIARCKFESETEDTRSRYIRNLSASFYGNVVMINYDVNYLTNCASFLTSGHPIKNVLHL